ncbi:hypothetical protein E2C01_054446 [Portunus trituberculatus]|uniref:Uncharacterized protein n=1 Tax=Portunus trituberculatus TaxID=210409 RepID=A0A5B7GNP6_PORTR|nr:hypothetical protein [Portunus trituberculatus]
MLPCLQQAPCSLADATKAVPCAGCVGGVREDRRSSFQSLPNPFVSLPCHPLPPSRSLVMDGRVAEAHILITRSDRRAASQPGVAGLKELSAGARLAAPRRAHSCEAVDPHTDPPPHW